ncbi:carbohydrate ABC transporter membrane protein 1 (CUT1 family) [Ruminiclostridium sufflavum DSM 19573]|uniref:Carbohydrate ABC transporter membrane protein 1 (CUT1 family) n=1 Tax=Ruminiclostridium sufflavum DSM 19573 TaxID=1121337 RepID=A0A318Y749_9FIRM|nr:sugar ABC transporter permease [Ruminiclostridium sufflavum]PYG87961.1 carbohydrate ABC transporter membrane protein 1 (CUT1 family) [Ruminiclostridium sufflavum DSM 19573]
MNGVIKLNKKRNEEKILSVIFLAPAIILILCMTVLPIIYAVNTSLHATEYAQIKEFIGLKYYREILGSVKGWSAIFNSISYVLMSLLLVIPIGTICAVLLNQKIAGRTFIRTLVIIPWVLSQTVTALLWKWLLNSNYGPVSYIYYSLTGQKIDFFNTPLAAKFTVVLANVWNSFPIVLILILAALQSISADVYEAAQVDGATRLQTFFKITLPLLKPIILTTVVLQSMEYFNMVTLVYTLTSGGPFNATQTMSVLAFKEGFEYWHLGYGSASSIIILVLNMLFSIFYMKTLRKKD